MASSFLRRALNRFKGGKVQAKPATADTMRTNDPRYLAVVEEALRSGKPVIGTIDKHGKLTMTTVEWPDEK